MKRWITLLIAVLMMASVLPVGGLAEGTDSQMTPSGIAYEDIGASVDAYIAERKGGLASCAVSVFDAQGTVFTGYYGYSDIENAVPAGGETVYEWGSNSKLLVWVSLMQLWERGMIDLDADIREYLPDGFLTKLQYPEEKITVLNLMAHNAGFQESYYENQEASTEEVYGSLEEAVRACECYQAYHVGETTAYSNWSTALAAYIVERVSGTDYVTYVHENILAPLGMEHTSVDANMADSDWVRQRRQALRCYGRYADPNDNADYGPCLLGIQLFPAGAVTGTLEDFARFGQALVAADCPLFEKNATREEMFRPVTTYGDTGVAKNCHGFWTGEYGVQTLGHGGNTVGCTANIEIDPVSGLGIVVMANEPGETAFCYGIPGLLFGDILSREEYRDAQADGGRDLSGIYMMKRTFARGAYRAASYMGGTFPWSRNGDGTYSMKLLGREMGPKLIPLGENRYLMRDNGMDLFIVDNGEALEMSTTDLVRFSPLWTALCFGFIAFGLICLLVLLVKLVAWTVRKARKTPPKYQMADRQILIQQAVYGVSGAIFMLYFNIVGFSGRAFTTLSCILAAALALLSLVNGILLCYNTIKANSKALTKMKRYIWAALGAAYAAFILVMQLYNFWNL